MEARSALLVVLLTTAAAVTASVLLPGPRPQAEDAEAPPSGRCSIVGTVRKDGIPSAARVEARYIRPRHSGRDQAHVMRALISKWFTAGPRHATLVATATAGSDGTFELNGLAPGLYRVLAYGLDGSKGGADAYLDVEGECIEARPVLREATGALHGRVLAPDGGPWRGSVYAVPKVAGDLEASAETAGDPVKMDGEGRFTIGGLSPGTVVVVAVEDGSVALFDYDVPIPFAGEYVMAMDPHPVERTGRVLNDKDGSPVAGAVVLAMATSPAGVEHNRRTATDSAGRFQISLPLASGRLVASAEGFSDSWERDDDPRTPTEVHLSRSATATGRVTSAADGRPLAGVRVTAEPTDFLPNAPWLGLRSATTDADGRFEFDDLPRGAHRVIASGGGWISESLLRPRSASEDPLAVDFDPARGNVLNLQVVAGARAAGTVVAATGGPVEGALVFARAMVPGDGPRRRKSPRAAEAPMVGPVASDADGSFVLDSMVPGLSYIVTAEAPGWAGAESDPIMASVDHTAHVEVRLPPRRWVDVTVVEESSGQPVADADVAVVSRPKPRPAWEPPPPPVFFGGHMSPTSRGRTDPQGHARVGPVGLGALDAHAMAEGFLQTNVPGPIEGSETNATEMTAIVRIARAFEIAGRALLPDGSPAAGARVTAESAKSASPHAYRSSLSDGAGFFRVRGLAAGKYVVRAVIAGDAPHEGLAAADAGAADVRIVLEAIAPAIQAK